jgi:hypothetical protein
MERLSRKSPHSCRKQHQLSAVSITLRLQRRMRIFGSKRLERREAKQRREFENP